MKIRILDRILVAIAGLIILMICAGVVAQVFFNVDMLGKAEKLLTTENNWIKVGIVAACIILLLIGSYCLLVLFRHRRRKDRFILQKMESGDLAISLKAMETMVSRCLEQQSEIETQSIRLENQRDGLIIRIRGTVASGVSIPLTVDTLQKQIKQYVTACSGVEVKGIRVQIESSGEEAPNAPFKIDAPAPTPLLQNAEKKEEEVSASDTETIKAEEEKNETHDAPAGAVKSTAESAMEAVENLKKEYEEEYEDDRPIHQRLFSTPEEPCIMPLPPEDLNVPDENAEPDPEKQEIEEHEEAHETASEKEADIMKQPFDEPEDFIIGEPEKKESDEQI